MIDICNEIIKNLHLYKRDFPWRHTADPYKIMIAEFMLHRTKAEQVAPIYVDFLEKYPNVSSLANAKTDDVSEVTLHLGLHWRAVHFIDASKYLEEKYGGTFPDTREELMKIPGVGDYVAGAILTVCYKKSEYVIDSNIARFINRYYGLHLPGEIRRKKIIIEKAKEIFKCEAPDKLLFAILDFTSLVCKPRNPDCLNCCLKGCAFSKNDSNNAP
jgi:A/G-specific adenine glycosylase